MEETFRNRIYIVFTLFGLFLGLVIVTSFYRQVINSDKLLAYSNQQILRTRVVFPKRGNIYDRNGSPLAINLKTYSVFALPKQIKDKNIYKKLSKIIPGLSYQQLKRRLKGRKKYTWLARKISLEKEQIKAIQKIKGIFVESVPKRYYPNHNLLSQTIGFVGVDNVGLAGLEYRYDKELKGTPKHIKYHRDAKGRAVKYVSTVSGEQSQDLHLTVDKELQMIVEKQLKEVVEKYKAQKAGAAVMDVKTGEILAIANYPNYDPNNYRKSRQKDRILSYITVPFEPGSVFKTFTIASALEHNVAKPDTNFYCERGRYKVEDHYIKEAESDHKYEWLSVSDILKLSSNIGTTKIAFDLTYPKLKETLLNFNIGKKLNIQIPGESRGIFHSDSENVSPLSLSNISFGQGVATTALQILAAYAAIANDGLYNYPTIIKGEKVAEPYQAISTKTAKELQKMLQGVVSDGTGTRAAVRYFDIAGKTSTAQRPLAGVGYEGYIPGFVGFPLGTNHPFVSFVYVEKPIGRRYFGNTVAAPVFRKIAEYILYKDKNFNNVAYTKSNHHSRIIDSVVIKSAARLHGSGKTPDFIGLDKKSALRLAQKLKLKVTQLGIGIVSDQFPLPGAPLKKQEIVTLKFKIPDYE